MAACNYQSILGSVHQVPITAGWTEAVWNTEFAQHFYTWPALGFELQTLWSWVQCPIHLATCSHVCGQVDRVNHIGILILIIYGDKFITPCNLQEVSALVVHYNSRSCVADCSQAWILPRILTLLHCQAHPLCFTILDHIEIFRE